MSVQSAPVTPALSITDASAPTAPGKNTADNELQCFGADGRVSEDLHVRHDSGRPPLRRGTYVAPIGQLPIARPGSSAQRRGRRDVRRGCSDRRANPRRRRFPLQPQQSLYCGDRAWGRTYPLVAPDFFKNFYTCDRALARVGDSQALGGVSGLKKFAISGRSRASYSSQLSRRRSGDESI
jgi:hypothetical protein